MSCEFGGLIRGNLVYFFLLTNVVDKVMLSKFSHDLISTNWVEIFQV